LGFLERITKPGDRKDNFERAIAERIRREPHHQRARDGVARPRGQAPQELAPLRQVIHE
jgi:hypothetical protein